MSTSEERLASLRRFNLAVRGKDKHLGEESLELAHTEVLEMPRSADAIEREVELESIVMRRQRPVLAILDNVPQIQFEDPDDSKIWKSRLEGAKSFLESAIRAVGRIDLVGSPYDWIGTGWLVSDSILVTNRHVANEFAIHKGVAFAFRMGTDQHISASIDFLQEIGNAKTLTFKLVRPLHIEAEPGPDVSLFEVEVDSGDLKLAKPIVLAGRPAVTENVAVIGYPAYDSRIPDPELMEKIYGKTYNKKRLAPGGVTRVEQSRILHTCTTLGGNSGSVVVDLDSGEAFGLHFSGTFMTTNYAVRSDVVKRILANVRTGRIRPEAPSHKAVSPSPVSPWVTGAGDLNAGSASVTIPLTITISLGGPLAPPAYHAAPPVAPDDDVDMVEGEEAVAEDYRDRTGYNEQFLGKKFAVPLPTVSRDANDVLEYDNQGNADTELRYEHFSVVMSKKRRMCFFSAANIDGNLAKKNKRVGWKWDPRIAKTQQIMNECYGNPPKFSRGHMTRREDPGWGDAETAKRGNEDSMHVTNTTPQMQAFNAPIWLALEDYALDHAKEDQMKIAVFTGPYFAQNDSMMYGIKIPRAFWKIIAFIHDDTGRLCATGYEMSQDQSLPEEEFVFGAFRSPQLNVATQVPIRSIETRSGISFAKLASVDPLAGGDEGLEQGGTRRPLQSLEQIRFLR